MKHQPRIDAQSHSRRPALCRAHQAINHISPGSGKNIQSCGILCVRQSNALIALSGKRGAQIGSVNRVLKVSRKAGQYFASVMANSIQ